MSDYGIVLDGVLMISAALGFGIFAYWWGRNRRATIVYIYVTVLLLGISVEKFMEFFFRVTFIEYIHQESQPFCVILNSTEWQLRSLLLTSIVVALVVHMTVRMIKTIMGVKKLKAQIKNDDRIGYASSIMIVEDDDKIPGILKDFLKEYYPDLKVILCTSGEEALEVIKANKGISVFLLDIHLRGKIDGFELCTSIREQVPWGIIIGMTGFPSQYPLSEARARGFDDYFIKPFRLSDMHQALKCHVERMRRWGKIRQRKPPSNIY